MRYMCRLWRQQRHRAGGRILVRLPQPSTTTSGACWGVRAARIGARRRSRATVLRRTGELGSKGLSELRPSDLDVFYAHLLRARPRSWDGRFVRAVGQVLAHDPGPGAHRCRPCRAAGGQPGEGGEPAERACGAGKVVPNVDARRAGRSFAVSALFALVRGLPVGRAGRVAAERDLGRALARCRCRRGELAGCAGRGRGRACTDDLGSQEPEQPAAGCARRRDVGGAGRPPARAGGSSAAARGRVAFCAQGRPAHEPGLVLVLLPGGGSPREFRASACTTCAAPMRHMRCWRACT